MNWKQFCSEYDRTIEIMDSEHGIKPGFHPVVWIKTHSRVRKYTFHTLVLTSVIVAVVTMDKSAVFASAELSVTLIAHTYAVVANLMGKKE